MKEAENIIFKSDLNGSITPGSNLVWNKALSNLRTWSQNNDVGNAYLVDEHAESNEHNNKAATYYHPNSSSVYLHTFRPIFDYR